MAPPVSRRRGELEMSGIVEVHRRAPSALAFMSRALARLPRLATRPRFVPIVERWVEVKSASDHERRFRETTGLDGTSILYPQVLGFRLRMALLTHPSFPLPPGTPCRSATD
jgi:hypothetical protein